MGSVGIVACADDEDTLYPDDVKACRFTFPQGDGEYDKKIEDFYEKHDCYIIYKDITNGDINRAWLNTWNDVWYEVTPIDVQNIGFYYDFYDKNLFQHFKEQHLRFLPMYLYILEEMTTEGNKLYFRTGGLDYLCISGTEEELDENKRHIRQNLTWTLMSKLIALDSIRIPEEFTVGINYTRSVNTSDPKNSDYYINRGFVGTINNDFTGEGRLWEADWTSQDDDFIRYLKSSIYYDEAGFLERYPPDVYPLVKKRYDLVTAYMKKEYGIDLKAIAAK